MPYLKSYALHSEACKYMNCFNQFWASFLTISGGVYGVWDDLKLNFAILLAIILHVIAFI